MVEYMFELKMKVNLQISHKETLKNIDFLYKDHIVILDD